MLIAGEIDVSRNDDVPTCMCVVVGHELSSAVSDGSIFVCAIFSRTLPNASQVVYSKELPGLRVL